MVLIWVLPIPASKAIADILKEIKRGKTEERKKAETLEDSFENSGALNLSERV